MRCNPIVCRREKKWYSEACRKPDGQTTRRIMDSDLSTLRQIVPRLPSRILRV